MWKNHDLSDYMGFRYVELQRMADVCADAARKGDPNVTLDCDDLTEDDLRYLEKEVERRLSVDVS